MSVSSYLTICSRPGGSASGAYTAIDETRRKAGQGREQKEAAEELQVERVSRAAP